jgi:DNA-directed RNA polymerase subunit RPC12/RpoP
MIHQYKCSNCGFTWNSVEINESDARCPICLSEQVILISNINRVLKNNKSKSAEKLKTSNIHQYIVPWMLEN